MAEQINEDLFWIGVNNPEGKDFHGIPTERGGSYNSYLIKDTQSVLIETTNNPFFEEYLKSLNSVINPDVIEYIVINHAETDHTGALKDLLKSCKNAKIVCTEVCKEFLQANYGIEVEFIIVKDFLELNIGSRTLKFIQSPMVHWPETMLTYDTLNEVLFSGDLFGAEIAHESLFADEMKDYQEEIDNYFALVLRPFKESVISGINKSRELKLSYICPSHGPVYRKDVHGIINYYEKLSTEPEDDSKVLIVYDSIWHSTEKMARSIAERVKENGKIPLLRNLSKDSSIEIMAEALTARSIAFGSLTIAGGYHPNFETLFALLKLLRQDGKRCAVFGTYGWASASVPKLKLRLEELKYEIIGSHECRFSPKDSDKEKLKELGNKLCE